MATLSTGQPLSTLARILHAAVVMGPDGEPDQPPGEAGKPRNRSPKVAGRTPGPERPTDLASDLRELFDLLNGRGISYLLVGGVALLRYVEGRNTDDLDLVVSIASLKKIPEIVIEDRSGDFARAKFKSLRVDLLLTKNPLFKHVHDHHAAAMAFREVQVRCATVEGLVLLKLYALPSLYRQGNAQRVALYEGDITMLCLSHAVKFTPILETLREHVTPGELKELKSVVSEIEQRVARLKPKSRP